MCFRKIPPCALQNIFSGLEERYEKEVEAVRMQYPSEPVSITDEPLVVHWEDGIQMLRDAGHEVRALDPFVRFLQVFWRRSLAFGRESPLPSCASRPLVKYFSEGFCQVVH